MKNTSVIRKQDELVIIENGQIHLFPCNEIIDLIYDAPYVNIRTVKGNKFLFISLSKLICGLPEQFVYCNRAVVINVLQAEFYNKKKGIVRMKNGSIHPVSVRRRNVIEAIFTALLLRSTY
jgi:DNA-binding LytR/AlgR family response regulator